MDIDLKTFCREVPNALTPYAKLLSDSREAIENYHDKATTAPVKTSLAEIQNRLGNLNDRLEGQNTFLLIFGPLKSGKSTLMNAISKSYVSEVTSLPAYPCLVYVKNARTPKYSVTQYSGDVQTINGGGVALKERIDEAHIALGKRLLEVEKDGEAFDPRVHALDAIRRVDIELPADELGDSGIVLVDTPGLYTRMKFGYGLMTREFRNHAACAVFVVKAENLFFEQVFAEFEDLLKVFSRIFLVVNIDASKKDLAPDGSLKPSVEAAQPTKLIEAFESLAMSVPLSEAYHEGRLNIYTADLLTAAQGRLSAGKAGRKSPEFERFMGDLTEYLHSSDYLLEFMKDSLSQSDQISKEVRELLVDQFGSEIKNEALDLQREERDVNGKMKRIDEVGRVNWDKALGSIAEASRKDMDPIVHTRRTELERDLNQSISGWMATDESLADLINKRIRPAINSSMEKTHVESLDKVRRECQAPLGGASLAPGDVESFKALGISLEDLGRELSGEFGKGSKVALTPFSPEGGELGVKKKILDYLLFRSRKSVARKLFGDTANPSQAIPADIKAKRLGPDFQNSLMGVLRSHVGMSFDGVRQSAMGAPVNAYRDNYTGKVRAKTTALRDELGGHRRDVEAKIRANTSLDTQLGRVSTQSDVLERSIAKLRSSFLSADGKSLAKPKAALPMPGSVGKPVGKTDAKPVGKGKSAAKSGSSTKSNPAKPLTTKPGTQASKASDFSASSKFEAKSSKPAEKKPSEPAALGATSSAKTPSATSGSTAKAVPAKPAETKPKAASITPSQTPASKPSSSQSAAKIPSAKAPTTRPGSISGKPVGSAPGIKKPTPLPPSSDQSAAAKPVSKPIAEKPGSTSTSVFKPGGGVGDVVSGLTSQVGKLSPIAKRPASNEAAKPAYKPADKPASKPPEGRLVDSGTAKSGSGPTKVPNPAHGPTTGKVPEPKGTLPMAKAPESSSSPKPGASKAPGAAAGDWLADKFIPKNTDPALGPTTNKLPEPKRTSPGLQDPGASKKPGA